MIDSELKRSVVDEIIGLAENSEPVLRKDLRRRAAVKMAIETAIENWNPMFRYEDEEHVRKELTARIKPIVRQKLLKSKDETFGIVFVITASMIFTWVLQAIIVTAVAALVNWWITSRLDRERTLEKLTYLE